MKSDILDMSNLCKNKLSELDDYIASLEGNKQEQLIHVLHKAQGLFGYLPHNLQLYVARALDLPAAKVNGVVTFYSYFTEKPTGKNVICVCMGTACYVKGAQKVLDEVLKQTNSKKNDISPDGLFTVKEVRCIGACGLAPVMTVNDKVYGNVDEREIADIISKFKGGHNEN
ncbi:MAG: NAD(P)H-dependent oxidoreductase subunit E [Candidatus Izemoplasmatales bacterium]|jgi:NADH:ubiquinone oxidoreductase subunit E|nr:NAD(P)H-dependent oxidoreductase subunit E [Candidatus Izemoplasmatales bacterium]